MDTLQYLTDKTFLLECKIDSLLEVEQIKELNFRLNEKADVITSVSAFYESAWLKLILVISILGIILPILIQFFQRQNLKEANKFLSKEINETFNKRIEQLETSNKTQIENLSAKVNEELKNLEKKNKQMENSVEASLFYLQGKQNTTRKMYDSALHDFVRSAKHWPKSDKPERIGILLVNINTCIKMIKRADDFHATLSKYDINWDDFMAEMSELEPDPERLNLITKSIENLE